MKPKSPGSSSDLERARALAARLAEDAPANAPAVPPPPGGYVVFSAARFTGGAPRGPAPAAHRESPAPAFAPPPPAPPHAAPRLEPVRSAPEPHRPAPRPPADLIPEAPPPAPRPVPPRPEPRAEAPRPVPPPPPLPEPEPEPPAADAFEPSPAFEPPPGFAPAFEPSPAFEDSGTAIEEEQEREEEEIAAPNLDAGDDEAVEEPPPPPAVELEEENLGVLPEDAEEPPAGEPPPSWAQILDDCLYLARARSALVMDRGGRVVEARGEWPKNTLEKIAVRLKSAIDKAVASATDGDTPLLVELQLGAFWLTGIRVMNGDSPAIAGFLAQAPLRAEVRPALEGELSRGQPLL
jgi:hypothetical protein